MVVSTVVIGDVGGGTVGGGDVSPPPPKHYIPFFTNLLILELCLEVEWHLGARVAKIWWEQV